MSCVTPTVVQIAFKHSKTFYDLIRLPNCLMASLAAYVAGIIALMADQRYDNVLLALLDFDPSTSYWPLVLRGIWIPFLIVAGSMALNDWKDYENDVLNHRFDRPLVRGDIQPRTVFISSVLAFVVGLSVCFLVFLDNILVFIAALFFSIISVAYSMFLKKTGFFGNVIVGICFTAPFLLGALAARVSPQGFLTVLMMSLVILFVSLGREVLKGVQDLPGDREKGIKSLANILGPQSAAFFTLIFWLIGTLLAIVVIFFTRTPFHRLVYTPLIFVTVFSLNIMALILIRTPTPEMAGKLRGPSRYVFWIGLMAFAGATLP